MSSESGAGIFRQDIMITERGATKAPLFYFQGGRQP